MPKFSFMIPVYNKSEYLKCYLNKVLNQTYEDYEVIIVDDYSCEDDSYEYLSSVANENSKIKLYRNSKNIGIGLTRNVLLNRAKGKYLIFVDPDDYVEEKLLEKVNDSLADDIDIVRFQNIVEPMTENQRIIESSKNPHRFSCDPTGIITGETALLKWCLGERKINTMPWTYCVKKELYNDVEYPDTPLLEDFAITPYLLAKEKKVIAIDFIGYHYLQYDNSLTKTNVSMEEKVIFARRKLELFKEIIQLTKENIEGTDISDEAKWIFLQDVYNRYHIRENRYRELENEYKGLVYSKRKQ